VWLPEEGQLRQLLEDCLASDGVNVYDLLFADESFTCRFARHDEALAFAAQDAAEAYAAAVLHLMGTEA
jgi:hypothetical protein